MNLYRISQTKNGDYDTYDSAVVAATSADEARHIHPDGGMPETRWWEKRECSPTWVDPGDVEVEYIGTGPQKNPTVICSSYNAG
jgi:hypothetical protein